MSMSSSAPSAAGQGGRARSRPGRPPIGRATSWCCSTRRHRRRGAASSSLATTHPTRWRCPAGRSPLAARGRPRQPVGPRGDRQGCRRGHRPQPERRHEARGARGRLTIRARGVSGDDSRSRPRDASPEGTSPEAGRRVLPLACRWVGAPVGTAVPPLGSCQVHLAQNPAVTDQDAEHVSVARLAEAARASCGDPALPLTEPR